MIIDDLHEHDSPRSSYNVQHALPSTCFVKKLYALVTMEDPEILSFIQDGSAFEIKSPKRLENEVLPKYYRHCRFQSFVRQLCYYSFKKISKERNIWIYQNDFFHREHPELLEHVKRKSTPSPLSASGVTSSSVSTSFHHAMISPSSSSSFRRRQQQQHENRHRVGGGASSAAEYVNSSGPGPAAHNGWHHTSSYPSAAANDEGCDSHGVHYLHRRPLRIDIPHPSDNAPLSSYWRHSPPAAAAADHYQAHQHYPAGPPSNDSSKGHPDGDMWPRSYTDVSASTMGDYTGGHTSTSASSSSDRSSEIGSDDGAANSFWPSAASTPVTVVRNPLGSPTSSSSPPSPQLAPSTSSTPTSKRTRGHIEYNNYSDSPAKRRHPHHHHHHQQQQQEYEEFNHAPAPPSPPSAFIQPTYSWPSSSSQPTTSTNNKQPHQYTANDFNDGLLRLSAMAHAAMEDEPTNDISAVVPHRRHKYYRPSSSSWKNGTLARQGEWIEINEDDIIAASSVRSPRPSCSSRRSNSLLPTSSSPRQTCGKNVLRRARVAALARSTQGVGSSNKYFRRCNTETTVSSLSSNEDEYPEEAEEDDYDYAYLRSSTSLDQPPDEEETEERGPYAPSKFLSSAKGHKHDWFGGIREEEHIVVGEGEGSADCDQAAMQMAKMKLGGKWEEDDVAAAADALHFLASSTTESTLTPLPPVLTPRTIKAQQHEESKKEGEEIVVSM